MVGLGHDMSGEIKAGTSSELQQDHGPDFSATRKRIIVQQYLSENGVTFDQETLSRGADRTDQYTLTNAPLGIMMSFTLGPKPLGYDSFQKSSQESTAGENHLDLHIQKFDLIDEEVYRQGFGTELLRQAILRAHADRPVPEGMPAQPSILSTARANLGKVKLIAKLAGGLGNVSARKLGVKYGNGHPFSLERAIESTLDDGSRYLFDDVEARINPTEILARDAQVQQAD